MGNYMCIFFVKHIKYDIIILMIKNIQNETGIIEFYRYYFITLVVKSSILEETAMAVIKSAFENMGTLCKLEDVKNCGKKKFTYPIQKQDTGLYVTAVIKVIEDDNLKNSLEEITRKLKTVHEILRFLVERYNYNILQDKLLLPDNLINMKSFIDKNLDRETKR